MHLAFHSQWRHIASCQNRGLAVEGSTGSNLILGDVCAYGTKDYLSKKANKFPAAQVNGGGGLLLTLSPQLSLILFSRCTQHLTCDGLVSPTGEGPIRRRIRETSPLILAYLVKGHATYATFRSMNFLKYFLSLNAQIVPQSYSSTHSSTNIVSF